jgi:hypothetical protein
VKVADLALNVIRHAATGVRQQSPALHNGNFRVRVTASGPGRRLGTCGHATDYQYAIMFHGLWVLSWQSLE